MTSHNNTGPTPATVAALIILIVAAASSAHLWWIIAPPALYIIAVWFRKVQPRPILYGIWVTATATITLFVAAGTLNPGSMLASAIIIAATLAVAVTAPEAWNPHPHPRDTPLDDILTHTR